MLSQIQKSEVNKRVDYFVKLGNKILNTNLDGPHIKFDQRGTTGATACYPLLELNFNAGLIPDNWAEYMNQVIPHEVAHLLKSHIYGRGRGLKSAHGLYWKQTMRALGVNPDRTHRMDTSKVAMPKAKHIYECQGCQKELIMSSVRHNKTLRGTKYRHCFGHELKHIKSLGKITNREAVNHIVPRSMKKQAKKSVMPKPNTKIAKALNAYNKAKIQRPNITRQEMIGVLTYVMEIEHEAAAGYYQNCKKRAA